jgi:hypothetical protein
VLRRGSCGHHQHEQHDGTLSSGHGHSPSRFVTFDEVKGLDRIVAIAAGTGGSGAASSGAVRDDGSVVVLTSA